MVYKFIDVLHEVGEASFLSYIVFVDIFEKKFELPDLFFIIDTYDLDWQWTFFWLENDSVLIKFVNIKGLIAKGVEI